MRDFLKTIGAIVIIGLIVVATFLYGNKQRQEQLRRDQQATQQSADNTKVTVDNTTNNTVVKPENSSPTNPAPAASPSTTNKNVGGGTISPSQTPDTGGEVYFLIPVALITGLYQVHKHSKKNLRAAAIRAS
ncbi:MAG TPA: hypothetical protein VLF41_03245 [Candidatus Nanoarchaeia archaeon]|nr:hypothetical protein [Candidatus Nanoarchaeia archaeon]